MSSNRSLAQSPLADKPFFNSRFIQHFLPHGSCSDATERARSIATAIDEAAASGCSCVCVPASYRPFDASLISSKLTTSNVYLIVEDS